VHHARLALGQGGSMFAVGLQAVAGGLGAKHFYRLILQEGTEQTYGVGTTTHAGHQVVWQATGHLVELFLGLIAYDGLEVPNHHGERVRADL